MKWTFPGERRDQTGIKSSDWYVPKEEAEKLADLLDAWLLTPCTRENDALRSPTRQALDRIRGEERITEIPTPSRGYNSYDWDFALKALNQLLADVEEIRNRKVVLLEEEE